MLHSKPLKLLLLVTLGSSALLLACGPMFPPSMLSHGADAFLSAPWQTFQATIKRLTPTVATTSKAKPPTGDESQPEQQLRGELAQLAQTGVSATLLNRYRDFRTRLLNADDNANINIASLPDGLPSEFRLYLSGAVALKNKNTSAAADYFGAVLALPPEQRPFKSTAAAYMLGIIDHQDDNRDEPSSRFSQVRALAADGFADPEGLAAASYGQEARLYYLRQNYPPAIHLYLQQHATDDTSVNASLRFCIDHILEETASGELKLYAADPVVRQLVSARLLSIHSEGYRFGSDLTSTHRWLAALQSINIQNQPEAETLALLAYTSGEPELAATWLTLAPAKGVPARWIRAKLALRDGDTKTAIQLLSSLMRDPALDNYFIDHLDSRSYGSATQVIPGELAALHLARRDFTEALQLFLRGDYWEDAAYVAERILTTKALAAYIRTVSAPDDNTARLSHLLARRLFRDGQLEQARPWFPSEIQPQLDRYTTSLAQGRDHRLSDAERATALMTAARLLREHGMELAGTELAPDYFIWDGQYQYGITLEDRIALAGPAAPSREEINRANQTIAEPALRYHYRHRAADLAWEATTLLPDNSTELAANLIEAGGWIKNHNPQLADRFYKALVTRCPQTEPGRLAKTQRWFP